MAEQLNLFGEPVRERAKVIVWELSPAEREAVRRCGVTNVDDKTF